MTNLAFWRGARAFFHGHALRHGITIERVLTDNRN